MIRSANCLVRSLRSFSSFIILPFYFNPAPEGVVVHGGGNLGDFFEQFLEEGAGEEVVGLGQDAGELRVVLLDVAHGVVDLRADVRRLGEVEQEIKTGVGREVEDALGVIGGGFIHARATTGQVALPTIGGGFLQLGALGDKADFGEAQEDDAEDRAGVFLGLEAGVGAELVGGVPEALFERGGVGVFFRMGRSRSWLKLANRHLICLRAVRFRPFITRQGRDLTEKCGGDHPL